MTFMIPTVLSFQGFPNPIPPLLPPPPKPELNMMYLYGEWSLWYADFRSFVGPNKIMVYLYPKTNLEIVYKRTIGPCLFVDKEIGSFTMKHLEYHPNIQDPSDDVSDVSDMNDMNHLIHVNITFKKRSRCLVSILGIGLEELEVRYPIPLRENQENMEMVVVGRDDLFLTTTASPTFSTTYHLIRSSWVDQPTINVPFSTLVATQVLGMVIGWMLHYLHMDSLST